MEEPFFIRPGEGERIRQHRVLAELPHIEADSSRPLEGEVEFFQDGEWHRVGPGSFLSVPPDVEHGFRPAGTAIRLLNFHTPNDGFIAGLRD